MIKNLLKYLSLYNRKIKYKKISYSFNAVDLIIDYIFKNKKKGVYLDIGCQHPISNNNTYLLFKRGWHGINIDLDINNIKLFNLSRPNDLILIKLFLHQFRIKNYIFIMINLLLIHLNMRFQHFKMHQSKR